MPQATRLDDYSTGHDACAPVPLITASPNVFINNKPAGRVGDMYKAHGCDVHAQHQDEISAGSATVFINNKPAGRVGDDVVIGGAVNEGSPDVFIGG